VTTTTTSYGLRLGRSSTIWKAYQVYFHTDPASYPYHVRVVGNRQLNTESYSVTVLRHLNWADGPCIKLSPLGTRHRVRERPQHPWSRSPTFLYLRSRQEQMGF